MWVTQLGVPDHKWSCEAPKLHVFYSFIFFIFAIHLTSLINVFTWTLKMIAWVIITGIILWLSAKVTMFINSFKLHMKASLGICCDLFAAFIFQPYFVSSQQYLCLETCSSNRIGTLTKLHCRTTLVRFSHDWVMSGNNWDLCFVFNSKLWCLKHKGW